MQKWLNVSIRNTVLDIMLARSPKFRSGDHVAHVAWNIWDFGLWLMLLHMASAFRLHVQVFAERIREVSVTVAQATGRVRWFSLLLHSNICRTRCRYVICIEGRSGCYCLCLRMKWRELTLELISRSSQSPCSRPPRLPGLEAPVDTSKRVFPFELCM